MNCPNPDCGVPLDPSEQFCPLCGTSVRAIEPSREEPTPSSHDRDVGSARADRAVARRHTLRDPTLQPRYGALRTIAQIFKIVAIIIFIAMGTGAILAFAAAVGGGDLDKDEQILLAILAPVGFLIALFIYGGGEVVKLFIDLEENTRAMRKTLEHDS